MLFFADKTENMGKKVSFASLTFHSSTIVSAKTGYSALLTVWAASGTDVPTMQDEPMMGQGNILLWDIFGQFLLGLERILAIDGQSDPI